MKIIIPVVVFLITYASQAQTRVRLDSISGFEDRAVREKLDSAVVMIEHLVNHPNFAFALLNKKMVRKRGYTGRQIVDLLLFGQEEDEAADHIINLQVQAYGNARNEIGHTDENGVIHTNKQYILDNGAACYAAHLIHEYGHVMGFSHFKLWLPFRYRAVPYAFGDVAAQILQVDCP